MFADVNTVRGELPKDVCFRKCSERRGDSNWNIKYRRFRYCYQSIDFSLLNSDGCFRIMAEKVLGLGKVQLPPKSDFNSFARGNYVCYFWRRK